MSDDDRIPTISATISNNSIDAMEATSMIDGASTKLSVDDMVQQKFKDNEKVLSLFEAYQIIGQVQPTRYLVLIVSHAGGTYAVFSLTTVRSPPLSSNDLTIDKIFPLNEGFNFSVDSKSSVSNYQFDLRNADELPVKFFYYPVVERGSDFETFHAQVISAKMSMANSTLLTENNELSYSWIYDYRQIGEVKQELKRREHEYIVFKDFKIYCATWNVNNKSYYGDTHLHLWLGAGETPPDIYAIALQELDTSAKAITFNENRPDTVWINKMLESVHKGAEYVELKSVRLVGIMLTIIVRKEITPYIARCRVKSIARGVLNTLGNKGGVAVSIQLNEGNICFVNSHLAAHMEKVTERNNDYAGIVQGIIFDNEQCKTINKHDHIFWIGDLNYRIEEPPGLQLPMGRNDDKLYEMLFKFDQLTREMRCGHCFQGYTEGSIHFKPTYKYDVGTDNFDSSEKQRAPAYCDRILYKGTRIEQLAYNSVMEIRQSDHKPVYAVFNVKIKSKDEKRYKRVHEEVLKLVDKRENENQPQIMVDKTVIEFGLVPFNEIAVQEFNVSNYCPMPVEFMFKVKDPPINDICEKWLEVEPKADILQTDTSKTIRIKVKPDIRSIRDLLKKIRTTNWKFEFDILILHVKNGPDMFITVAGEYKPSCFGLTMETLCRTTLPLNDYTQAEIKLLMNDESPEFRITMPREFFLLIDYLHRQGGKVGGAFASLDYKNLRGKQLNEIRNWLDTWSNDEFPGTPHAAAEALLLLLDLPEKRLLDPYVDGLLHTSTTAEAMETIAQLSSPKRNVFVHLCMFLREGIEKGYYNLQQASIVFGYVLLGKSNSISSKDSVHETRCYEFMRRFLSSDMGAGSSAGAAAGGDSVAAGTRDRFNGV